MKLVDRRDFLRSAGGGLGFLALNDLIASETPGAMRFAPRAKRVIYLFMHGGPSHVDLFDPKPDLIKYSGQPLPASYGEVKTRRKVARNPLLAPVTGV